MKTLMLLASLLFTLSVHASQLPETALTPAVLIKDITQRGNLMPGPGVRRAVHSTVEVDVKFCRNVDESEFELVVDNKIEGTMPESTITIKAKNILVDCFGPARLQTLVFETNKIPAHVSIHLANPLLVETNFVY